MSAWAQTVTGRVFDYVDPVIEHHHLFNEIAHALGILARFAGHADMPYSVAQHCVLMAECALDETGDPELAAFALLRNAHEAYLGDTTSPVKAAWSEEIRRACIEAGGNAAQAASLAERFAAARRRVERRIDVSIFRAAGLDPMRSQVRAAEIKQLDSRALLTERRDLMRPPPKAWDVDALRLKPLRMRKGTIRPWPWGLAVDRYQESLTALCPAPAGALA